MVLVVSPAAAQPALDVFRVFLKDGRVLNSHGECATLTDELVCVVKLGEGTTTSHHVLTVPRDRVDELQTAAYARALRTAWYGAARGEQEFLALSAELSRVSDEIKGSTDAERRLIVAMAARARVATWSADRFGYRATDTQELVTILDDVIAELRIAVGRTSFAFAIEAPGEPPLVLPLMAAPTAAETISAAMTAAAVTPVAAERLGILRAAATAALERSDVHPELRASVHSALREEEWQERRYRALMDGMSARADAAVQLGRPEEFDRLVAELDRQDALMGGRRPYEISAFARRLSVQRVLAEHQHALNAQAAQVRSQMAAYEQRVRPAFDVWVTHRAVFRSLKNRGVEVPWPPDLDRALRRLMSIERTLSSLDPPPAAQRIHSLIQSAVQLARHGLATGKRLIAAPDTALAQNASSAIAGAELLLAQARSDLRTSLRPRPPVRRVSLSRADRGARDHVVGPARRSHH